MICNGCQRTIEVGDQFIEDSASGFVASGGESTSGQHDALVAELLGSKDGKIRYCSDCTQDGGDYMFETNYGDDATPDVPDTIPQEWSDVG